jgi:urate oxidase
MAFLRQRYGKANVRVLRVQRDGHRHQVRESRVTVILDGEFSRAYTDADNAPVVATDTMKNLVNVLALEHLDAGNESFALTLAQCFLDRYEQVADAQVRVEETVWDRMRTGGREHEHGFVRAKGGTPFACAIVTRSSREVEAGFQDFSIMKTTGSGFVDYLQDEYTTLQPTTDRILATRMAAAWHFKGGTLDGRGDYDAVAGSIREALLRVFAATYSHSVQDSLYRMGEAALAAAPDVSEITLRMPNVHYLPIDLSPFGRDARGKVFLPTDEPSGQIEATLRRE